MSLAHEGCTMGILSQRAWLPAIGLAWLLGAAAAGPAAAVGLAGQSLGAAYYHPDTSTPYLDAVFTPASFVVGAGRNNTPFNGVIFTAAADHGIASATVHGSTTMAGFDDSRVSFTDDQLLLNWAGLSYVDGTVVRVDFTFVPEAGAAWLAACGALGLALVGRRRA
jgi:hypothetical protein